MNESRVSGPEALKDFRDTAYEILIEKFPNFDGDGLRKRLEGLEDISVSSPEDLRAMVHEGQIYQIELELQNEELRKTQTELENRNSELRKTREELESAKEKYRFLYESAPVGYVSLDDKGRIVSINAKAARMLGADPGAVLDQSFSSLIGDGGAEAFDSLVTPGGRDSDKSTAEIELEGRDGKDRRIALLEAARKESAGPDGFDVNVAMIDITRLKDAEEALQRTLEELEDRVKERTVELKQANRSLKEEMEKRRAAQKEAQKSEERLRAVFEGSRDLILIKDKHLRIQEVNAAVESLHGIDRSELVGRGAEDIFDKEIAKRIKQVDNRVLNGDTVEFEHSIKIKGREMTLLDMRMPLRDSTGRITGVFAIARDMTERRQVASRRLRVSSSSYTSQAMRRLYEEARKVAQTDGIILLQGESGTGKDHLARWIHEHSPRSDSSYFVVNCAALSPELAESELFGHEGGAFTGARGRKRGLLELAEGGSLLLNEIGELSLELQSKLLTFLDTNSFMRVGGEKTITVDARIMAATHRDLDEEVEEKRFLEPLYHRLNVFKLTVPPLRERTEDIPQLVKAILADLAQSMNLTEPPPVDSGAMDRLMEYDWPGNVRELKNTLERALMLWDGEWLEIELPATEALKDNKWAPELPFPSYWSLRQMMEEVRRVACINAIKRADGNKRDAARMLGISRDALYRHLKNLDIDPEAVA